MQCIGQLQTPSLFLQACSCSAAVPRMLGCRNDFCKIWKTVRYPANCHYQAEQGKVEAVLLQKPFLSRIAVCVSVTPGKSIICTSQGFLSSSSSSLLLGTKFEVLFLTIQFQICRVFLPYPISWCTQQFTAFPLRGPGGQEA